jgi:hypothetical protein
MESHTIGIKRSNNYMHSQVLLKEDIQMTLTNDGCKDSFNNINSLSLSEFSDIDVFKGNNFYYFISEVLNETEILVNISAKSFSKSLRSFLVIIYAILPGESIVEDFFKTAMQ